EVLGRSSELAKQLGADEKTMWNAVSEIADVERRIEKPHLWRKSRQEDLHGKEAVQWDYRGKVLEKTEGGKFKHENVIKDLIASSQSSGIPVKKLYKQLRSEAVDAAHIEALLTKPIITIDIGATNIKYGVYDPRKANPEEIQGKGQIETLPKDYQGDKKTAFLMQIRKSIKSALEKSGIDPKEIGAIGIGNPGPVNNGVIQLSDPKFEGIGDIDLAGILEEERGVTVAIGGDAGNAMLGAAKRLQLAGELDGTIVGITVGTGIGGGVVMKTEDGFQLYGGKGSAVDIGAFPTEWLKGESGTGHVGRSIGSLGTKMLGTKGSGLGIVDTTRYRIKEVNDSSLPRLVGNQGETHVDTDPTYRKIQVAADSGDRLAQRVMESAYSGKEDGENKLSGEALRKHVVDQVVKNVSEVRKSQLSKLIPDEITAQKVDELAEQGDELAKSVLRECGQALGVGMSIATFTFDPTKIVLMGGPARSRTFVQAAEEKFRSKGWERNLEGVEIRYMNQDIQLMGSAALAEAALRRDVEGARQLIKI
ncbi:ROK family protein, partial [Candidatus Altiarchaeota archaeon]